MSKPKSVLDGIPVVESKPCEGKKFCPSPDLGIVGQCPACGAPIYGPKLVPSDTDAPVRIRHGCNCHLMRNNWMQQTK